MPVHIAAEDVDDGFSYNGTWNLNREISGIYKLDYLHFDISNIPWMWSTNRNLVIQYVKDEIDENNVLDFDFDDIGFSSDYTAIAASLENDIQQGLNGMTETPPTVSVTYADNQFEITTSNDGSTIIFQWESPLSNCKYIFDKENTENEALSYPNSVFLPTRHVTLNPIFLYLTIMESSSKYITSSESKPTLIITTQDTAYLNQEIDFPNSVSALNLIFHRVSDPIHPVPVTADWDIVLAQK